MPLDGLKRTKKRISALKNRLTSAPFVIRSGVPRFSHPSITLNSGISRIIIVSNENPAISQSWKKETSS